MGSHLESVVKREPVEEDVREELAQAKDAVHHPVRQPFCVVFFAGAFNGFDSAGSQKVSTEKDVYLSSSIRASVSEPQEKGSNVSGLVSSGSHSPSASAAVFIQPLAADLQTHHRITLTTHQHISGHN